jgi:hypothetical protein
MARRPVLAAALRGAVPVLLYFLQPPATTRADDRVSQPRPVAAAFTRVKVAGPFDVTIREGIPAAVTVTAVAAQQEKVRVEVKGDTLVISTEERWSWGSSPSRDEGPAVAVTLPELRGLEIAGSGEARAETGPAPRDLALSVGGSGTIAWKGAAAALGLAVSGSGELKAEGPAQKVDISVSGSGEVGYSGRAGPVKVAVSGSGDVKLAGEGASLEASTAGSGDVEAGGFPVRDARISISGSGDASLALAGGSLAVRTAGSGDVVWTGEARNVDTRIAGSGSVTHR